MVYRRVGNEELMLDMARPKGSGPFPAIVFIHGGGWYQGSRQAYHASIQEAADRGYVAVTVSYRLMEFDQTQKETTSATPIFPAQLHDVKAAIRWLRANSDKYGIDPMRIGVTGASAGGHLSLMLGLSDEESDLEGDGEHLDQSSRVQAVVNVFGPTDMEACYTSSSVAWIFRLFLGGTPDQQAVTYSQASPIFFATADDPPVLTLHGDQDLLVPIAQAKMLDAKMQSVGGDHSLRVFEGSGHGFAGETRKQADAAMWAFFQKTLKP
jgi:acetyl esterase/lipase